MLFFGKTRTTLRRFRHHSLGAISLIEVLVTVVIVSVLAVIVVPASIKLRESGERAVCAGNLRQIGAGIAIYASEHNMTLPPGTEYSQDTNPDGSLGRLRRGNFLNFPEEYMDLGSRPWKTFACPSDYTKDRSDSYTSYAQNYMFLVNYTNGAPATYQNGVPTHQKPIRLAEAQRKILYVDGIAPHEAESWDEGGRPPNVNSSGVAGALLSQFANITISRRHRGNVNALFGDGSVQFMSKADACEPHYLDRD